MPEFTKPRPNVDDPNLTTIQRLAWLTDEIIAGTVTEKEALSEVDDIIGLGTTYQEWESVTRLINGYWLFKNGARV